MSADKLRFIVSQAVPADELWIIPDLPRRAGESLVDWRCRRARGAVRMVNLSVDAPPEPG